MGLPERMRAIAWGVLLAAGAAGTTARAGETQGVLARNGDKLTADLSAGDQDSFTVQASEGGSFGVSLAGAAGVLPTLRVFRPDGSEADVGLLVKGAGGPKPKIAKLVPAAGETGAWRVVVGGGATAGTYTASFKVVLPKAAAAKGMAVADGGTATFDFTGDSGALATVTLKAKSGGTPVTARLLDPAGSEVAGSAAAFTAKGKALKSAPISLAGGFGRYRLEFTGAAGGPSTVDVVVKLKFAKLAKRKETLPPEATLASADPMDVRQGGSGLAVTMSGANLLAGATAIVEGAGVDVTNVAVAGPGVAVLTLDVDEDAPYGPRDVTVCPPPLLGEPVTLADAITVRAPDPAIGNVSLALIRQGDAGLELALTGTGFRDGGAITLSGAGLTLGATVVESPTRATTTVSASLGAEVGLRDVTFTQPAAGGGAATTSAGALRVNHPDPTLTSIDVALVRQGASGVALTLTGTHFRDGGTVSVSGAGVTASSPTWLSDTSFRVTLAVASDAAYGARDVTYAQPVAGGGASATLVGSLTVAAPTPTISLVSPTSVVQGTGPTTVTVNGTGLRSGGVVTISGTGLALGSTTIVSDTQATVPVTTDIDATLGARDATYTQPAAGGGASATRTGGLAVHAPTPTVTAIDPTSVTQGDAGVVVTLTGTSFRDSGSVSFGADVTASSPTRVSDTEFRVTADFSPTAALGPRSVTYTQPSAGGSAAGTLTDGLQVDAPAPTVSGVSPTVLRQGQTSQTLTVTGTDFRTGGAVTISGTGLTLGATTIVSATEATVSVTVDDAATVGDRDVTYTQPALGGSGAATKTAAFAVHHPTPTLASVAPLVIEQGASGTLTLTGTGFRSGGTVSTTGTGVTLTSPAFVSATSFTVDYAATAGATTGLRDVTYTQPAAGGGAAVTKTNAYEVKPPGPTLTSITPSAWRPGESRFPAEIVGTQFNAGTTVAVSGTGVTIHSTTFVSSTKLTVEASVASSATVGKRNLTITPGAGGGPANTFTDVVTVAPADPVVSAFSHVTLAQGASSVAVTVDGENFRSGDTLSASGTGISFTSVTVSSSTRITATAAVTSGATTGLRSVSVAHAASEGGASSTLPDAVRVISATPSITSANPSAVGKTASGGATRDVPITVTGTNFMTGATLSIARTSGSGVSVKTNSVVVDSDTSLRATLTITASATTGTWNLQAANPGSLGNSGTTGNSAIDIKSDTTLTVNNVLPASGSAYGGERVTIHGAGFAAGDVADFGTVRARGTQVIDGNTIVTTVPAPASVSATSPTVVNVKVTNTSAASATLTGGYSYAADEARFVVVATIPAQSATGRPDNLKSACVLLSAPCDTTTGTHGSTGSTNSFWFGSSAPVVSTARSFAVGNRWLVLTGNASGGLATNTYVMNVPTTLTSQAGTALSPERLDVTSARDQYSFGITNGTVDSAAPTLTTITPGSSASSVDPTTKVVLLFSEEIDPLTVSTTNITFKQSGTTVGAGIAISDDLRTVTITPDTELAASTTYTTTVGSSVKDLCGNAFSSTSYTFTTSSSDATAPVIDSVTIELVPASMDGSGTYVNSSGTSGNAFDLFLPRSGFLLDVRYSDAGGSGIDTAQFSAKCSVAVGSSGANAELASNFDVTATRATWRVPSTSLVTAGENVTFTFLIKDRTTPTANTSASHVVTVDVIDKDTTATGDGSTGHSGGDHDPFDSRRTWILRSDMDAYTATYATTSSPVQRGATTTASANNVLDLDEALRLVGLNTASMTADAASTANGTARGTNAIVRRMYMERFREVLRARFDIDEDGTHDADSVDIEFLLPGEQGSLGSLPTYSTVDSANSTNGYSEIAVGGSDGAESSAYATAGTIGRAYFDARNLRQEADLNTGSGTILGVFCMTLFKQNVDDGSLFQQRVSERFVAIHGGTPVGEHAEDDAVLAGTFDRTASGNTATQNTRYDEIQDAIELCVLGATAVAAHEVGHSLGLVENGAPKTGLFGGAHYSNSFTEATSTDTNTSHHLDFLGNDIMAAATSFQTSTYTGADFKRFSPLDIAYLLNRLLYDEGR